MAYQKMGTPRFYINLLEWMGLNKLYTETNFPTDWEAGDLLRYRENEYKPKFSQNPVQDPADYTYNFPDLFRTYPRIKQAIDFFGINLVATTLMTPYQNILDHGTGGNSFIAFLAHDFGSLDKIKYALQATYDMHIVGTAGVYRSAVAPPDVWGCTDPSAPNYDPLATIDDGSCEDPIDNNVYGCMDPLANNYDPLATVDNGSCEYPIETMFPYTPMLYSKDYLDNYEVDGVVVGATAYKGELLPAIYGWSGSGNRLLDENGEIIVVEMPGWGGNGVSGSLEDNTYELTKGHNFWCWLSEGLEVSGADLEGNVYGDLSPDWYPEQYWANPGNIGVSCDIYSGVWNTNFKLERLQSNWVNKTYPEPGPLTQGYHGVEPSSADYGSSSSITRRGVPLVTQWGAPSTPTAGMFFHGHGHHVDSRGRDEDPPAYEDIALTGLINAAEDVPSYNGFSISTFNGIGVGGLKLTAEPSVENGTAFNTVGSVIIGSYYDMPHSPELSLTMTREMDGVYKARGKSGHDFIDQDFIKPRKWGRLGAWELSNTPPSPPNPILTEGEVFDAQILWNLNGWDAGVDEDYYGSSYIYTDTIWYIQNYSYFGEGATGIMFSHFFSESINPPEDFYITAADVLIPGKSYKIRFKKGGVFNGLIAVFGDLNDYTCQQALYQENLETWPGEGDYVTSQSIVAKGTDLHLYVPPSWGNVFQASMAGNIQIYQNNADLYPDEPLLNVSKVGRRIWDLEFSYLSETDIFSDISSLSNFETTSPDGTVFTEDPENHLSVSENTLTQDNTFFSQILHKTNGGQLPFIFQPDNTNNNPDQFALAKFDMSTFKFEQVANGVYNIKVKIKEVW